MPDVFDEIEAPATSDVFDEIAPETKDVFDEIEGGKPVVREVQPGSIPPTDLFPAIRKIGGEIVPGQIGDTHPDIIRREGIAATDIDQRGFTTPWGDFLDREAAAQGTQLPTAFEPGRLHSTDLSKFQEGLGKPLEEAAAAEAPQPFLKLPEPSARPSPIAYAPVKAVFGQKGVDVTKSVFDTVYNTAKSVPEFLQTEEGMLAMLASATPLGRAGVEAYFTGDMLKSLWDQAKSGVKDWDSMSAAQKAGRITQAIATLGFTGFLAKAGIGTINQAIKKPSSLLAPTVPQSPAKPEEVAPEAVQAPADIAKELGVETVGTSMGRDHYQFPTGKTEAGMEMDRVQVPAGSSINVVRDAIEKRKAQVAKDFAKEEPAAPAPATEAKPEVATLATGEAKNHLGDPLGTTYRATPEDWAAWQALQGRKLTEEGVFAERERIKNKYGGMPPEPPTAPEPTLSVPPTAEPNPEDVIPKWTIGQVDGKWAVFRDGKQYGDTFSATENGKEMAQFVADAATRGAIESITNARAFIETRVKDKTDIHKTEIEKSKAPAPEGYVLEGDRYVYRPSKPSKPSTPTPVEPAPAPVDQEPANALIDYAKRIPIFREDKTLRPGIKKAIQNAGWSGVEDKVFELSKLIKDQEMADFNARDAWDKHLGSSGDFYGNQAKKLEKKSEALKVRIASLAQDILQQKGIPSNPPTIVGLGAAEKGEAAHIAMGADVIKEGKWEPVGGASTALFGTNAWTKETPTGTFRIHRLAGPNAGKFAVNFVSKDGTKRHVGIFRNITEAKKSAVEQIGPGMVDLGAATAPINPPGSQIEQLTQALKGVQEKRAPLVEQVKDAFSVGDRLSAAQDTVGKALSGMKAAGDMIISKWKGIPKIDDLLRAKKTLSRAIESRGWRLLKWEQQARKSVPNPRDQAAIAKWIDAGGDTATLQRGLAEAPDKFKQAYQDALNLSGDKLTTAQNVQNYFEARLQEAIDAGVLDHGIDNYIHRMYESKPDILKRAIAYTQTGLLKTNPALAKKRFFQFDWEAEKAGYVPVQSFIKRITAYEASLSKAIAAREFIKSASEMKASDGRPVIDIKGVGIPIEDPAGVYREATLIKPKFNPARNNEPTLPNGNPNPNYRGDYVNRDYRALSRWKWVGSDAGGKPIYVQGDVAIHPEYANRIDALLKPSQVRYGKYGSILRPALGVSSTIKQTMLDLSGFHPVQIAVHGMEHRVMPWSVIKDIDLSHPDVEGLLQGGVTLGGDYTGLHSEGLIGSSLTRRIPGLGPVMESYHQWLFQDFIPRIKMTMALHALERNRARYAGRLTEEQIFHKTASEANAAFGELNYTVLERSKTAQDMARLILLAPDFLEARARFAGQAFQRGGKAFGHEQRTALLLGALTMWVTARIANKMIDGQYHNEPENLFNIVKDGHAYGLRTVQGDLLHLLTKPMQFAMSRLNPVYGRTLFEMLSGRDYFGRKRNAAEQVWDFASTTIPISLRSNRERKLWESLLNGFGVTARRYSEVDDAFKLAQKWKDKNAVPERGEFIYDPNKDVLRPLKLALNHGDEVTAAKEIKALIDSKVYNLKKLDEYFKRFASMPFTGSKANDSKFIKSLTEDQRKTVEAARQHKNEIRKLYMKSRGQYLAPPSQL